MQKVYAVHDDARGEFRDSEEEAGRGEFPRAQVGGELTRCAAKGYDISFLVTNFHGETMLKHKLVDFIIEYVRSIESMSSRSRFVAGSCKTSTRRLAR